MPIFEERWLLISYGGRDEIVAIRRKKRDMTASGSRSIRIIDTYKSSRLWDDKIDLNRPRLPGVGPRPTKRRLLHALLIFLRCEIIDKIIKWLVSKSIPSCCYQAGAICSFSGMADLFWILLQLIHQTNLIPTLTSMSCKRLSQTKK